MSQFTFLTERERKIQAAAICREVNATVEAEVDLGRKISAPKDIMLDELSLASNRGSRLFKMRQRRSEKYTFESIQNEVNTQINKLVIPPISGIETTDLESSVEVNQAPNTTHPNTSDPSALPNPDCIAPGYGGPLKEMPTEKFNCTAVPKSYHSPWEQALIGDPALAETLLVQMPELETRSEKPEYKSFNRVATPFGGFDKAPRVSVKSVEEDLVPSGPSLPPPALPVDHVPTRPSFNRTALGWVSERVPLVPPTVNLEPISSMVSTFIPESDEL
ncbi:myozenin-2a [Brachyhypopomus gauderio]|uniref:myozenin-2a n=1 Tax=Brachyhypopomus gauderio TaxID=698409 RepID=UPI004042AB23